MPKYFLVIAHADPTGKSHSHKLAQAASEALTAAGHECRISDLVKDGFLENASSADFKNAGGDPFSYVEARSIPENLSPLIKEQQSYLEWCDYLLIFAPIWFYRLPGVFYAWEDRVWTQGWAYDFTKPKEQYPLFGKKAMFVVTAGAPGEFYSPGGPFMSTEALLYLHGFGLHFCGFTLYRSQSFYSIRGAEATIDYEKWKTAILKIDKRPVLQFEQKAQPSDSITRAFEEIPNLSLDEAAAL